MFTKVQLNRYGQRSTQLIALLLLIAALALPSERKVSDSAAEHASDGGRAAVAKPKKKPGTFRGLAKVNPLRLLQHLDAATTQLAIRFSSWPTDHSDARETPKAARETKPHRLGHDFAGVQGSRSVRLASETEGEPSEGRAVNYR